MPAESTIYCEIETSYGINIFNEYLKIALGIKPQIERKRLKTSGFVRFFRYKEGIIRDIRGVEEYLSGNEVSVESIVYEGEVFHFGITQKFTGDEPYFEEVGHYFPAKLPEELQQEILKISTRGIKALGIDIGATHTELRLTSKGPIIIEIAARLGGDKIPYIVDLEEGTNMAG